LEPVIKVGDLDARSGQFWHLQHFLDRGIHCCKHFFTIFKYERGPDDITELRRITPISDRSLSRGAFETLHIAFVGRDFEPVREQIDNSVKPGLMTLWPTLKSLFKPKWWKTR